MANRSKIIPRGLIQLLGNDRESERFLRKVGEKTSLGAKNNVNVVSSLTYTISTEDEEVFFDTDSNDITATLPPGVEGQKYRLVSVGSSGNKVILTPYGTEKLFLNNSTENIYDYEALTITYDETFGWN